MHQSGTSEEVLILAASNIFAGLTANIPYSVAPDDQENQDQIFAEIAAKSYDLALVIQEKSQENVYGSNASYE